MDGVGKIRVGDAIWPVADLLVAILVTVATAGLSGMLRQLCAMLFSVHRSHLIFRFSGTNCSCTGNCVSDNISS
jgi:hypothetical protein